MTATTTTTTTYRWFTLSNDDTATDTHLEWRDRSDDVPTVTLVTYDRVDHVRCASVLTWAPVDQARDWGTATAATGVWHRLTRPRDYSVMFVADLDAAKTAAAQWAARELGERLFGGAHITGSHRDAD